MNLKNLLEIVRTAPISVHDLASNLGVSYQHASRIISEFKGCELVETRKIKRNTIVSVNRDSDLVKALDVLSMEGGREIGDLLHPLVKLKMMALLSGGPLTTGTLLSMLDISRSSLHRNLLPLGPAGIGLVLTAGKRERTYFLDKDHPLYRPFLDIATGIFDSADLHDAGRNDLNGLLRMRTRILIHLLSLDLSKDGNIAPEASTQRGISGALWTNQQAISKVLKELVASGSLVVKVSNVINRRRRYRTYSLSENGHREAEELLAAFERVPVKIIDLQGIERTETLSNLSTLSNRRIRTVEILNYLSRNRILNLSTFLKNLEKQREGEFVSVLNKLPRSSVFYGREKELATFAEWLSDTERRTLLVTGIAGIGKTSFVLKAVRKYGKTARTHYQEINERTTPRSILLRISWILDRRDMDRIRDFISGGKKLGIVECTRILSETLDQSKSLIVFDDVHKASKRVRDLLGQLASGPFTDDMKLVLIGREIPGGLKSRTPFPTDITLSGLGQKASWKILENSGMDRTEFEKVFSITGGHPLVLEMIGATGRPSYINPEMFIQKEIRPFLSRREEEILSFASVFKIPFPESALFSMFDIDKRAPGKEYRRLKEELERLTQLSLLECNGGFYSLHDLFRRSWYSNTDEDRKRKYHMMAAEHYRRFDSDPSGIERLYHLACREDFEECMDYLSMHGMSLLGRGYLEDLQEILDMISEERLNQRALKYYHYLRGETAFISGDWNSALLEFRTSIDLCGDDDRDPLVTEALVRMANIHQNRTEFDLAEKMLEKVVSITHRYGRFLQESRAKRSLGKMYFFTGNIEGLRECYTRVKEIAERTGSKECLINSNYLATFISTIEEDYDKCIALYTENIGICEELNDRNEMLIALNNLAAIYGLMERWREALETFERQMDISSSVGNMEMMGFALVNSAACLIKLSRPDEAEPILKKAYSHFNMLGETGMIHQTEGIMAFLHKVRGDIPLAREYFEKAIGGCKETGMRNELPEFLFEYAEMELDSGRREKAKKLFRDALDVARATENQRWMERATRALRNLSTNPS